MGTACVITFVRVLAAVIDSLVAAVLRTLIAVLTGVTQGIVTIFISAGSALMHARVAFVQLTVFDVAKCIVTISFVMTTVNILVGAIALAVTQFDAAGLVLAVCYCCAAVRTNGLGAILCEVTSFTTSLTDILAFAAIFVSIIPLGFTVRLLVATDSAIIIMTTICSTTLVAADTIITSSATTLALATMLALTVFVGMCIRVNSNRLSTRGATAIAASECFLTGSGAGGSFGFDTAVPSMSLRINIQRIGEIIVCAVIALVTLITRSGTGRSQVGTTIVFVMILMLAGLGDSAFAAFTALACKRNGHSRNQQNSNQQQREHLLHYCFHFVF